MGEACQSGKENESDRQQITQSQRTNVKSTKQEEQQDSLQSFLSKEAVLNADSSSFQQVRNKECVGHVGATLAGVRMLFQVLYHHLTGHIPRLLPATDKDFERVKQTLIQFYGLEDRPDVWLTVCGQMTGRPITSNRISYKRLAIAGHRLKSNAVIKKHKDIEIAKLHARLEEITKQMADDAKENSTTMSSEAPDLQGDVQALPSAQAGLVSNSLEDGFY